MKFSIGQKVRIKRCNREGVVTDYSETMGDYYQVEIALNEKQTLEAWYHKDLLEDVEE
jgi:heat shock protein HspQ